MKKSGFAGVWTRRQGRVVFSGRGSWAGDTARLPVEGLESTGIKWIGGEEERRRDGVRDLARR